MNHYAGIDVSLRSVCICIVDETGAVCHESKAAAEVETILACLRRFGAAVARVGFEAGALSQYLTYGLREAGYEVVCMEARQVAATLAAMRNKTDRNDAKAIAQILRTGWYRPVHIKSPGSHQVRALLSSRKAILSKCIDLENELRGLLKVIGVRLPMRLGHGAFEKQVREHIERHVEWAPALAPMLEARTTLYKTFLRLEQAVRALAKKDGICRRLMTVPGIGPITALTFKVAVDEPTRFRSSRTVAAHFGLTPRRFQSGETDNPGHISKAGDPCVRQALYTAAHALLTRNAAWSALKAWGLRLAKARGHKRAVTAVARKLAVILHRMWVKATDFEPGACAKKA